MHRSLHCTSATGTAHGVCLGELGSRQREAWRAAQRAPRRGQSARGAAHMLGPQAHARLAAAGAARRRTCVRVGGRQCGRRRTLMTTEDGGRSGGWWCGLGRTGSRAMVCAVLEPSFILVPWAECGGAAVLTPKARKARNRAPTFIRGTAVQLLHGFSSLDVLFCVCSCPRARGTGQLEAFQGRLQAVGQLGHFVEKRWRAHAAKSTASTRC